MADPAAGPAADRQTEAELAHWQLAVEALADLDTVAAPEAWAALEDYLQRRVRDRLSEVVAVLVAEGRGQRRQLDSGGEPGEVRRAVLRLRTRYLQVETILDFYGHAVNSGTSPTLRALLRGYDALAGDSIGGNSYRLGIDPPPALVYLDRGLGAAILRGPACGCGTTAPVAGRGDQADPAQPALSRRALHETVTRSLTSRLERDLADALAAGWHGDPPSWPGCGATGPRRSLVTCTPSPRPAGPRSPRWPIVDGTTSAVYRIRSAIRIRSRSCE